MSTFNRPDVTSGDDVDLACGCFREARKRRADYVEVRPTTTLESAIRSRRFDLGDYSFATRAAAQDVAHVREVASK